MAESINNESTEAELIETGKPSVLSRWLVVLGWVGMLIFTFHACSHMVAAGDTWVAMACGRHFVNHGVDTVEPFSANSHKAGPRPREIKKWPGWAQWVTDKVGLETVKKYHPTGWVNQNWLTHVMFYWLSHKSPIADAGERSFNTLVYWKFAIYVFGVIFIYYIARILGAHPALAAVFSCFAMFVGRSFIDVRPAGFSNVLVAAFLLILVLASYRNILYIWLLVPLTVFWCNVHGGYLYAFIMLAPFVAVHSLTLFFPRRFVCIGRSGLLHTIAAGFTTLIAVIIFNPFHLTNFTHTFIISFSEHAKMWRTVNEWHPAFAWSNPVGTGFPFLVMLVLSIGALGLWIFSRFLQPKLLEAPKNELEDQEKRFSISLKIFGWTAAILICWVGFISFSFVKADLASFLLCAFFVGIILISIYRNVHLIYILGVVVLVALWITDGRGYAGRYIFPFVLLPSYVTIYIISSLFSKGIKFKQKNIIFPAATAIVTIILMFVFFKPLKMQVPEWDGVVHSWVGRVLGNFWDLQRAWKPVYEKNLSRLTQAYKQYLFQALYLINILSVIIWIAIPYLKKLFGFLPVSMGAQEQPESHTYQSARFDPAYLVIAALTIYMAIRSRRFIPTAAIAACPLMAAFLTQMVEAICASINFHKEKRFAVTPMPYKLQFFFILTAAVAVIFFGTWWSLKFKTVYLDPWPTDSEYTSVFMRMTASDRKPFHAGDFIRENNLEGKMFNYWTEGGFIAWVQTPDPETGKTRLQLFMDGRAQAAYQPSTYQVWRQIMAGGPSAFSARVRNSKLTKSDYIEIGEYISRELRARGVWLILMPFNDNTEIFVKGIQSNREWPLVFFDNEQKMFVDSKNPKGKKLLDGIKSGEIVYPDKFSENLFYAYSYRLQRGDSASGLALEFAIKAFNLNPSQVPMLEVLYAANVQKLKPRVDDFCKKYIERFSRDKNKYRNEDGYFNRITAGLMAYDYLWKVAKSQEDSELAGSYLSKRKALVKERNEVMKGKRW